MNPQDTKLCSIGDPDSQQRLADLQRTFPNTHEDITELQRKQRIKDFAEQEKEAFRKSHMEYLERRAKELAERDAERQADKAVGATLPSKRDRLIAFHLNATTQMLAICKAKNADYAGHGVQADPFANFSRVEALGIATTEQGFLTRMADKMSRLASLTAPGAGAAKVQDESVEDTLLDLANYCILLAAYRRDKLGAL